MRISKILGVVLLSLALAVCVLLGSLGWFGLGFGIMTDCTNNYSCTETGCSPCATTERWINAGGITQWILFAIGIVVLVKGVRAGRGPALLIGGAVALLVASTLTVVGTTWLARHSYCRPDSPDYSSSYCSVDA